jgi:hypothetical protein
VIVTIDVLDPYENHYGQYTLNHVMIYQYKIDRAGNWNENNRCQFKKKILKFQCEGQIGILIYENGEMEIINLLTLKILMKLSKKQFKKNMDYNRYQYKQIYLCSSSLVHLLPCDRFQFDCAPSFENTFSAAMIVFGYNDQIKLWHIIGTQIKSFNEYKYDSNLNIKSVEILEGD